MSKIINLNKVEKPLLVSTFRKEFYLISIFTLFIYFGLMVWGFYLFLNMEEPDYYSYEFWMGIIGAIQFFWGLYSLINNTLLVWMIKDDEIILQTKYLKKQEVIRFHEIVDYESEKIKIRGRITQSDGHLKFTIKVNFEGSNELVSYCLDQYTYENFFEIRQAILDKLESEN